MDCWIRGKLDLLVCNLQLLKLDLRTDLKVNLLYSESELSLGAASTSSLQGTVRVAPCDCRDQASCQCLVATPSLNHTYLLWLEVVAGGTALGSPPMALQPTDIVKPEAPVKLHLELAERGQVKLCWSSPAPLPFPLQHQVRISAPPGHGDSQMLQVALESSVAMDNALLDSPSSVQVRSRNLHGPGFWSDWSTPYNLTLGAPVLYFPARSLSSAGSNVSFLCLYKNHTQAVAARELVWWLDLAQQIPARQYSLVGSRVSKVTLFNLRATQPRGAFFYHALYCCHQSRECHHTYAEFYVVGEAPGAFPFSSFSFWGIFIARMEDVHLKSIYCPCADFAVICSFFHFPVKPLPPSNVGAELTRNAGLLNVSWTQPVFASRDLTFQIRWNSGSREDIPWQLYEVPNPAGSWAVIPVEQLCVQYVVQVRCRELDGSGYWSDWSRAAQTLVQDIQGLCFQGHPGGWDLPHPAVTGLPKLLMWIPGAFPVSPVDAVQSLSAYLVNSTCVVVVWNLSPQIPGIKSFVIEWRNLNREEQMKWLRVPPNLRKCFIYDHFILIEKYQFSLYPVFAGGVGKARATDQFAKEEFKHAAGTQVGMLQKSYGKAEFDLDNPIPAGKVPSADVSMPETLEHLFAKHPEPMSCEPLLLEAEMVLEDISITKTLGKEEPGDFLGMDSTFPTAQGSEWDSACSSSHFQSSSSCRSCQDGEAPAEGDLRYATVVSGLCRRKPGPRRCWDSCCFLGEHPIVVGAFPSSAWEVGSGALLLLPGSQPSRALSLVSSEGFSEPSDEAFPGSAERSPCYLGMRALQKGHGDVLLTDSSRATCQLQSRDLLTERELLQHIPSSVKEFIQSSLRPKGAIPYVPQFRVAAAKGQEATEKK
ncbi:Leptin receptor [Lonchura striata]|uniref:Leptin receptor n=1 Tax=Lonchura striata TaxID=40157 RepID=A0A218UJR4_9PASE|nr:Leptin receptor [Lonchura striata domestica]